VPRELLDDSDAAGYYGIVCVHHDDSEHD